MSAADQSPEVKAKRMRVWKHNTLQGHCAMGIANMRTIATSDTCTVEAQVLAAEIGAMLERLKVLCKPRVDHEPT